jgi:hypothetical protein
VSEAKSPTPITLAASAYANRFDKVRRLLAGSETAWSVARAPPSVWVFKASISYLSNEFLHKTDDRVAERVA